MDDDELPEGETVEMDMDEPLDVEDTDDGGAIVTLDEDVDPQDEGDFYSNLAETLPEADLNKLGSEFVEMLGRDRIPDWL